MIQNLIKEKDLKKYSQIIRLNGLSNDDVNKMYIQLIPYFRT